MTTALSIVRPAPEDGLTADLMAAVTDDFRKLMSFDSKVRVLVFPGDHPLLGAPECPVDGCTKQVFHADSTQGLCVGCANRFRQSGQSFEEFVATAKRLWRNIGVSNCRVPKCARPWKTSRKPLCTSHYYQQQNVYRLPVDEFIRHPDVRPLPGFGPCEVAACPRDREGQKSRYCNAHAQRRAYELRKGSTLDEETWRLTTPAVAKAGEVSLRGLPDRVLAEVLYGLQERVAAGLQQKDYQLRPLCDLVRAQQVGSLTELDLDALSRLNRRQAKGLLKHVNRFQMSPETERLKDIWDGAAFGMKGNFHFEEISQPWLRQATKDWAVENIPLRRGAKPQGAIQRQINSIARLSKSLRLHRDDGAMDLTALGRDDIVAFMNRLRYLEEQGEITAGRRCEDARDVRRLLTRMRTLGLTRPGQSLHGLPHDFTLREEDIPDDPDDAEAGRDLPVEVMRVLCDHLGELEIGGHQTRAAVELLIDTGRRPSEICNLDYECLDRDGDGKPVLIYDNHKALRNGRRLPIPEATAALILTQQQRARERFPDTPAKKLKLFPSVVANPDGTKAATISWVTDRHRAWVKNLPDILVPTVVEVDGERVTKMLPFDKTKIFPYAYRHTYAQRHADAGVEADVLRVLMDHRQLETTQRYYRVGQERRREAVDRVTTMQFDRHGNRVWRTAKTLLDSEHARRAVGEVAVPYGVCSEPSNVAAGGHDCPVRFRCIGCGHFRTDISYLPDLEAYLADLLRNRERLAAFAHADGWARDEAMPSDEEITRVRRLVRRLREDLDDLTDDDRTKIQEAVALVRRSRQVVSLGMPRIRQPLPDIRPERTA
ncbi:tyrosine-type recombinase/integrase [Streptomyces hygroscopicus]|uniref:tyrosine-type recombinase/integrase n=1 Tax=Streptomyces hygroscopicus TaxID=1912 RepID=UPI000781D8EB|nr:site-specific integrase [Streptomyces hygroscopicus]